MQIQNVKPKVLEKRTDGPSRLFIEARRIKAKKRDKALSGVEQGPSFGCFEVKSTSEDIDLASDIRDQDRCIKFNANKRSIEMQSYVDASSLDRCKVLNSELRIPPQSGSQKVIDSNVKEKTLMFEQQCHLLESNFNSTKLSSKPVLDETENPSVVQISQQLLKLVNILGEN